MKLVIPGVPPKYNTIVIIAVIIVLIFLLFPDILKNIIGGAIKGIGGGIQDGLNSVLQTPVSQDNKNAMSWLDAWGKQYANGSFLSSTLFDNSPGDASIDANTAANLWSNAKDCVGWFTNDMSGLQGQFASVIGNQTDISRVASLCMQDKSKMFGDWLWTNFYSYQPIVLMNFVKWGMSLPIN